MYRKQTYYQILIEFILNKVLRLVFLVQISRAFEKDRRILIFTLDRWSGQKTGIMTALNEDENARPP